MDSMLISIYGSEESALASMTGESFFACSLASIVLGCAVAAIYMFKHSYSKNFVVTLAVLPLIVQTVIMLVNGNIGAGIAVMGVFNLVRFRSIPGSAKDIGSVFLAMAVGLATGMGFVVLAAVFTLLVGLANVVFVLTSFGRMRTEKKTLKITVPEDLDFEGVFDEVLSRYAEEFELTEVRTSNMGSLYLLEYEVRLKEEGTEKSMLDELRCLNGNLKISLGRMAAVREVL